MNEEMNLNTENGTAVGDDTQNQENRKPKGPTQSSKGVPQGKKRRKKKKKSGNGAQIMAVLVVLLAFYLVFSLFIAGLILYSFKETADNTEIYSLNVVYDERILHKMPAETANTDYGLYIPFEYLSEIAAFGLAGDGDIATLFIMGTDNRIECTKNSSLIIINGNPVRISAPILFDNNDYLIPVTLIENFVTGIDVTYNEEKMICSISSDLGKSNVSLKLKLPEPHPYPDYFTDEDRYYNTTTEAE